MMGGPKGERERSRNMHMLKREENLKREEDEEQGDIDCLLATLGHVDVHDWTEAKDHVLVCGPDIVVRDLC